MQENGLNEMVSDTRKLGIVISNTKTVSLVKKYFNLGSKILKYVYHINIKMVCNYFEYYQDTNRVSSTVCASASVGLK